MRFIQYLYRRLEEIVSAALMSLVATHIFAALLSAVSWLFGYIDIAHVFAKLYIGSLVGFFGIAATIANLSDNQYLGQDDSEPQDLQTGDQQDPGQVLLYKPSDHRRN